MSGSAERSNRKIRFSALDAAIIIAIIAVAVTLVIRLTDSRGRAADAVNCEISYSVSTVRYTMQEILSEGDTLMLEDGSVFGTLDTMSVIPAVFYGVNSAGETVDARYPEDSFVDISGIITSGLYRSDGGFVTADGVHVAAGTELRLRTRTADITVFVTAVVPVG